MTVDRPISVTDAGQLLADEPPGQLAVLLAVLAEATTGPARTPGPVVVLHVPPGEVADLRRRVRASLG